MKSLVPLEVIEQKILLIKGQKVMLDSDLAELYGVETKMLVRAVKRNSERFPDDFMIQLTKEEFENLKYHFGTSRWGGRRYRPYSFTENGIAMLSSVLNSKRAIQVNIQIMRTFTKLREMIATHKDLVKRLNELEKKYDGQFQIVFEAIRQLIEVEEKPKRKIGFIARERQAVYRTSRKR
jgi:phage regulator Rha-like protein